MSTPNRRGRAAVVHVTPDPDGRGGMAAVVRGLVASPLGERYELSTITTHRSGSVATRLLVSLRGLGAVGCWCLRHPHGLVHVHAAVRGSIYRKALIVLLVRALRHPVLVHLHAGPGDIDDFVARLGPARRGFLRSALHRAQAVVSVSQASASAFAAAFGLPSVGVVTNAVPAVRDVPVAGTRDRIVALYLGGFEDPAKGGRELVSALPLLLAADARVRVVLAGPGEPPAELSELVGPRVEWRGWLDPEAKAAALAEADIVVLPSRSEGLPIVLLEAMAHGRAVVATRVGGIPELVEDGYDGVLVEPNDPPAIASAIAELAGDQERVAALAAAASRRAEHHSAAADVTDALDRLYQGLLRR